VSGRGAEPPLAEGDVLLQVNNHTADGLTLKEVRKLMDSSKERLTLVVRREGGSGQANGMPVAKGEPRHSLTTLNSPKYLE